MAHRLTEQHHGVDAVDPWLPLLLGLVSLTARVDAWLNASPSPLPPTRRVSPDHDVALMALVGVLSLRRTFSARLDDIIALTPAPSPAPPMAPPSGSLLR